VFAKAHRASISASCVLRAIRSRGLRNSRHSRGLNSARNLRRPLYDDGRAGVLATSRANCRRRILEFNNWPTRRYSSSTCASRPRVRRVSALRSLANLRASDKLLPASPLTRTFRMRSSAGNVAENFSSAVIGQPIVPTIMRSLSLSLSLSLSPF